MAYEEIGSVPGVTLGGSDKKTGKKNPTKIEGYLLRIETRPNKFNPDKPQNFYVLRTEKGDVGVYGKAGIDREMRNSRIGRMTLIEDTGKVLDTGKGNPMKVFKAMQDPKNTIEVTGEDAQAYQASDGADYQDDLQTDDVGDQDLNADASALDETLPARPQAPRQPAQAPSAERQRKVQELLSRGKRAS